MEISTILDSDLLVIDGANKLVVVGVRETSGPTDLVAGTIADGQYLKRSGTGLISAAIVSIQQTVYAEITADTATTDASAPGPDLFSQAITTVAGSHLIIQFSASGYSSASGSVIRFKLYVDGVLKKKCALSSPSASATECVGMLYKMTGLSAGAHTVSIEWYLSAAGTATINASSNDGHGASLLITEIK